MKSGWDACRMQLNLKRQLVLVLFRATSLGWLHVGIPNRGSATLGLTNRFLGYDN